MERTGVVRGVLLGVCVAGLVACGAGTKGGGTGGSAGSATGGAGGKGGSAGTAGQPGGGGAAGNTASGGGVAGAGGTKTGGSGGVSAAGGEIGAEGGGGGAGMTGGHGGTAGNPGSAGAGFAGAGVGGSAGAGGQPMCAPVPSGLVGRWPGDGTAIDTVGADDGSFAGTYAPGEVNQAFSIDQTHYVTIPDETALNPGAISVEAWLRHDTATATFDPVVKKQDNQVNGFALEFDQTGANLIFWVYTAASGWRSTGGYPISRAVWTHVVGSYDGSSINLYVNGVLAKTGAASGAILRANSGMMIGRDPGNVSSRSFVGAIDEVSIYNRALSANEVKARYDGSSTGNCP